VRLSASKKWARFSWLVIPAVILWAVWPLAWNSWDHVVDTRVLYPDLWPTIEPDIWLQIWILAWGAHVLPVDPLSLYQANAFFPTPNPLARSDHLLGMLPLFAPVWWLSGNPVLAFQLTMVASYLLCGAAMYALLRHLRCVRPVAIGIAIAWALMGFRVDDGLARAQLLQYQYLPFVILFFDRWLERGRARDLAAASLFLLWQTMTAYWHAYLAMFTAVATIVAGVAMRPARNTKRIAWAIAAFTGVLVVLVATSLPYLEMSHENQLVPKSLPARLSWYFASRSFPLGICLAAIAGTVTGWSSSEPRVRRAFVAFVLSAAAGILLSLGPAGDGATFLERAASMPRELAVALVPGFRFLRDEYRFLTLASVGIYGLAAIGLHTVWSSFRGRYPLVAASVLAAVFVQAGAPLVTLRIPVTPALAAETPPPVYAWLAEHGDGGTVLELPISKNLAGAYLDAGYMFFSTWHWLPLINGYTGHPPREYYKRMRSLAAALPADAAVDALAAETGLRWIVVHRDARDALAAWENSPRLRVVGDFGEAKLVEVLPAPASH
jgi:hypothetical protein